MSAKGRQTETKHGEFLVTEIEGAVEEPLNLPSAILGQLHVLASIAGPSCAVYVEPDALRYMPTIQQKEVQSKHLDCPAYSYIAGLIS
jgi:hypothetical protein